MRRKSVLLTLMVFLGLVLSACEGIILPADPGETPSGEEKYEYGQNASVESLEVLLLESFPVQVNVTLKGYLPDGCTEIYEINVSREGNTFNIEVVTRKPLDVACTMAIVPFETTIALDVEGLPAGEYIVQLGDVSETFTLDVDNELPGEGEDTKYSYGSQATVEGMQVNLMESFPVQVKVTLTGYLPDGCTEIYEINVSREENTFNIEIVTRKPLDVACTMAIVPFETTIDLDVEGLSAGDYIVQLGDLEETFTLDVDNELSGEGEDAKYSYGSHATVEGMQVNLMEFFPVQVNVTLTGYLPDGCTEIYEITTSREGNTFNIEMVTRKPLDVACTMAIVPFETTIALDVEGLSAGDYTVQYDGLMETFTLEQDNG